MPGALYARVAAISERITQPPLQPGSPATPPQLLQMVARRPVQPCPSSSHVSPLYQRWTDRVRTGLEEVLGSVSSLRGLSPACRKLPGRWPRTLSSLPPL